MAVRHGEELAKGEMGERGAEVFARWRNASLGGEGHLVGNVAGSVRGNRGACTASGLRGTLPAQRGHEAGRRELVRR